ncbi:alpha/beta hydrolase [Flavobacterium sp.]|uniref:alpha/beta hydrolase n=1 Tax=Flavobacterium sp. TaxID=239 RepID=UPI002B4B6E8B|nr:alpha/beta hydrolase [Flavobacterium sp.]HLP64703.1 alpha/beta hydrolase [Flavobacterium sp.]
MKTTISTLAIVLTTLLVTTSCRDNFDVSVDTSGKKNQKKMETTVQNYATDPNIDKGTKEFLKVLNSGGTPLEKLPIADARNVLVGAQAGVDVDLSGIEESEKTITSDGYTINLNIVRPENVKGKLPVFIFIHGGGWVLGDYPTHKRLVRDLVVASGSVAVFVNYSPSPEAKFPVAINEIYAATKWVAKNGDEINVDGKRLGIVGNSAGGNMAAVTTLMAKEKNGPKIKFQVLLWPVTNAEFTNESYQKFGTDRFLTSSVMQWMFDHYTTDAAARKSRFVSPLQATIEQLQGLPPALIQVSENDILRDEGEAYGRKLDEAGVKVTTVRYNGTIHDFGLLNALATLPTTRSMIDHAGAELRKNL